METMNISLPENLRGFVDSRVKTGGYSSVSEYVRDLVREDQKRQTQENLETSPREATCEMSLRLHIRFPDRDVRHVAYNRTHEDDSSGDRHHRT